MLRSWPPSMSPASASVLRPSRALVSAALKPAMPQPAITTSNSAATPVALTVPIADHPGPQPGLASLLPIDGVGDIGRDVGKDAQDHDAEHHQADEGQCAPHD